MSKTQHLLSPEEWKHLLSAECCLSNAAITQKKSAMLSLQPV